MAMEKHLTKVEVPTLEVGGWWDQEDMWGTQAEYAALEPHDKDQDVFLVLGAWNHGGWNRRTLSLGAVNFGVDAGEQFRKTIEATFFEKYLRGHTGFELKNTASFRTGVNKWERYDAWPPKEGFHAAKLYLMADRSLRWNSPGPDGASGKIATNYSADPANPIPYRKSPIHPTYRDGSGWRLRSADDPPLVS